MARSVWWWAFLALGGQCVAEEAMTLSGVVYVSRHGVRSPYGPMNRTAGAALGDDWSAWTRKRAKGAADYGMDEAAFHAQELTPHGKALLPLFGAYVAEKWRAMGLDVGDADLAIFADDSTRDVQTADLWLEGLGRRGTPVRVGNASRPRMVPVVSDKVLFGPAAPSTEEQTLGLFGGDVAALTAAYEEDIKAIQRVLDMPPDASICAVLGVGSDDCALENLPYEFTGVYWQGMFLCPLYYAQFFAEAWMFEYLSGVDDFAFGLMTAAEVAFLYETHIAMMSFAANPWNARAYGSAALGWIAAALVQQATGDSFGAPAMDAATPRTSVVALFVHDTNQLYLRELLGVSWIARGWQGNAASTGGALSFELHCTTATPRRCFVAVTYAVASPRQQRDAEAPSLASPPSEATLVIPDCGVALCPLADFVAVVLDKICADCVDDPLRSVLDQLRAHANPPPRRPRACAAAPPAWQEAAALVAAALLGVFLAWFFGILARVHRRRRTRSLLGAARNGDTVLHALDSPATQRQERLTLVEPGAVL